MQITITENELTQALRWVFDFDTHDGISEAAKDTVENAPFEIEAARMAAARTMDKLRTNQRRALVKSLAE